MFLLFNLIILLMYWFGLSSLYSGSNTLFVLYYLSLLLFYFVLSLNYFNSFKKYNNKVNLKTILTIDDKKLYIKLVVFLFLVGFLANLYLILRYGLPFLNENLVSKGVDSDLSRKIHYIMYLVNFLIISAMMAYIGIKNYKGYKKSIMAIILIISFVSLSIWLSRGFASVIMLTIIIYEFINALYYNKITKYIIIWIFVVLCFLLFFTYLGNLRLEFVINELYGMTLNDFWGMSNKYPTWFVWLYIYFTSPLENANQLFGQTVLQHKYGMLLFYVFVAPIHKYLFLSKTSLYPVLEANAGLTVSTFIIDAITDFGYSGPYIYIGVLFMMMRIGQLSLDKGIYGLLCYISTINMALWMIFTNAMSIGPFMIIFLFFLIMAWRKNIKL
jgi:hypothetical protein